MERRRAAACSHGLRAFDVKIDHDGVLSTSYHDGLAGFVGEGVDFLMRHIGWDIDEVACSGFTAEFEMVSPSHASSAANDVKDCLQFAMVMRSGPAFGWTTTVPAQSLFAPVRAWVMAAARVIPGVWGVLGSRSPDGTILTPLSCQSMIYTIAAFSLGVSGRFVLERASN